MTFGTGDDGEDTGGIVIGTSYTCAQLKLLWGSTRNTTYRDMYTNKGCVQTDGLIDGGGSMNSVYMPDNSGISFSIGIDSTSYY